MLFLFTLSGCTGLIYEIIWVRRITYIFGSSHYAVTIILTAFMAGLGIGSWLIGRLSDRMDENALVKVYILLEVGIGTFALFVPLLVDAHEALYLFIHKQFFGFSDHSYRLRFVLTLQLFIVPTTLMGATLPVLSRYLVRRKDTIAVTISQLYGYNTFGAAIGTVAAGYILLPSIGSHYTNIIAVFLNFSIAVCFVLLHRSPSLHIARTPDGKSGTKRVLPLSSPKVRTAVVICFILSGFTGMLYEVAWTRTLILIVGTTTYAFTTMLTTFLLGIAFGSILYRKVRRILPAEKLVIVLQVIIAFFVVFTIPLFQKMPFLYLSLYQNLHHSWITLQIIRFLLTILVMLVPTIALGCMMPAVSDVFIDNTSTIGKKLGKVYGLNTFGSVCGAAVTGLLLVPAMGMQRTIIIGAVVNSAGAFLVLFAKNDVSLRKRIAVFLSPLFVLCITIFLINPWSQKIMSSGVYVYADRYLDVLDRVEETAFDEKTTKMTKKMNSWRIWKKAMRQYKLLYYNVGPTSTVSVMERPDGERFLTMDGKTDASTGMDHDMKTQTLLGQLPMLFHPDPDEVFIVGLGSGVTAGSVLTHQVGCVDCAEFAQGVIEAASYFSSVNHNVLENENLHIIPSDARHYFLTSNKKYDVVISQPSNPWIDGQSALFTEEWYNLVYDHLNPDGCFLQWVPAYQMSRRDVKIIINTVCSVFPHTTAWTTRSIGEIILLSNKNERFSFSYKRFLERVQKKEVFNDIAGLGYDPELLPFLTFLMNEEDLTLYLYAEGKKPLLKNSDTFLITEYSTPRTILRETAVERFSTTQSLNGNVKKLLALFKEEDLGYILKRIKNTIE